MSSVAAPTCKL